MTQTSCQDCPSVSILNRIATSIDAIHSQVSTLSNVTEMLHTNTNSQLQENTKVDHTEVPTPVTAERTQIHAVEPQLSVCVSTQTPSTAPNSSLLLDSPNNGQSSPTPNVKRQQRSRKKETNLIRSTRNPPVASYPWLSKAPVQPWLSSSVWMNAPTLNIQGSNSRQTRGSDTTGVHRRQVNSFTQRNRAKYSSRSRSLGGKRQSGSVIDTVRNAWNSSNDTLDRNPIATQNSSPAEQVRSAWATRFENSSNHLN